MYIYPFIFVNIVIIIQDRRHVKLPADPENKSPKCCIAVRTSGQVY